MTRDRREVAEVTEAMEGEETTDAVMPVERASAADRTKVVLMAQVVVIVALVVVWSILRTRRGSKSPGCASATRER
jgi:hypothetical protein